jgi:hypothetical protein
MGIPLNRTMSGKFDHRSECQKRTMGVRFNGTMRRIDRRSECPE